MKVYHGSYTKIYDIELSKCEPKKDFGQGFYVTKFREQAEFWALRKGIRNRSDCVITEFEFNEDAYHDPNFRILRFEGYDESWFDFVVQNRQNNNLTHSYDIIEGPVADDKIQNRILRFLEGKITKEDFPISIIKVSTICAPISSMLKTISYPCILRYCNELTVQKQIW